MRIIAGDARSRRIISPNGSDIRPTSDRVKESLFDIIGNKVVDAKVLDLFAGTGNLGLEAVSRGASLAVFIDISRESIKIANENINLLNYQKYCEVYNNDALTAIDILSRRKVIFDIIFIDPPYRKDIIPEVLKKITEAQIIKSNGIVCAEHDAKDILPDEVSNIKRYKFNKYGDTILSFYRIAEE
ncbi:MAG: 16S rRNA (guanine(966)-N(2))-methyltransferase RsmD [Clostridiales bacterium]|nr:16S rRNA (guanine(966)-N(2))-methyltransferase RsmD [Clostridiales bacterium]